MQWVIAVWTLLLAVPVWAGQITVTVNDADLQAYIQLQARAANPGAKVVTPPTAQQAVQQMVDQKLAPFAQQKARTAACAKLPDAASKQALGCPTP